MHHTSHHTPQHRCECRLTSFCLVVVLCEQKAELLRSLKVNSNSFYRFMKMKVRNYRNHPLSSPHRRIRPLSFIVSCVCVSVFLLQGCCVGTENGTFEAAHRFFESYKPK